MICNMCGKQFKSQKTLTEHNRDVHIEEDIPCSLCDKTFRTKRHLANHKFNKHTEKEFLQCGVISDDKECSYQTTDVSNLNAHKKRVHEKTVNAIQQLVFKFACSSCDFKTGTKFNLERHNVTHMCLFKQLQIKKQSNIYCIYMTSLSTVCSHFHFLMC